MNSKYLLVLIVSLLFITACSSQDVLINDDFSIVGDVVNSFSFLSLEGELEAIQLEYNEKDVIAYEINNLLELANPRIDDYDVILISDDYFSVRLEGDSLDNTFFVYDENDKWVYISKNHPKISKVKNINEIIVVSNLDNFEQGLNIVYDNKTINRSIGNIYASGYMLTPIVDGNTSKTVDGNEYRIDLMKYKKMIPLENIINTKSEAEIILLASFNGEYEYLHNKDLYVSLEGNMISIYDKNKEALYENVVGIMLNPPEMSNLEIFDMVTSYLNDDQQVLVILVDGLSYSQYEEYIVKNKELFMSSIETVYKSTTVYRPVTNTGFSTIITGEKPIIHGVLDRSFRDVKSQTIFEYANEINKSSVLIEGDINILDLDVETMLNLDESKDGFNEDEIYASAMSNLDKDFVFVHFHSVDNAGHSYGPFGVETLSRIDMVDSYIEELSNSWSGKVLIVADHGMHETVEGGSHGQFRAEDIYVPILVTDGRNK